MLYCFFFFKQKTAYEMRISDWSSDVCSSDLFGNRTGIGPLARSKQERNALGTCVPAFELVRPHNFRSTLFNKRSRLPTSRATFNPMRVFLDPDWCNGRRKSKYYKGQAVFQGRTKQNGRGSCRERGGR